MAARELPARERVGPERRRKGCRDVAENSEDWQQGARASSTDIFSSDGETLRRASWSCGEMKVNKELLFLTNAAHCQERRAENGNNKLREIVLACGMIWNTDHVQAKDSRSYPVSRSFARRSCIQLHNGRFLLLFLHLTRQSHLLHQLNKLHARNSRTTQASQGESIDASEIDCFSGVTADGRKCFFQDRRSHEHGSNSSQHGCLVSAAVSAAPGRLLRPLRPLLAVRPRAPVALSLKCAQVVPEPRLGNRCLARGQLSVVATLS
eukprot:6199310-Pleurochrysis_carterae.AAC.3